MERKGIQVPDSMKRAMGRQAETECEKRAKIIASEGEAIAATALGRRLRHHDGPPAGPAAQEPAAPGRSPCRQNTTIFFPAPLTSTIAELSAFLARENQAAAASNRKTPIKAA